MFEFMINFGTLPLYLRYDNVLEAKIKSGMALEHRRLMKRWAKKKKGQVE